MSIRVETVVDKSDAVRAALKLLADRQVLVGIPSDKTQRNSGDPIDNAALGYIHENGSPARNIPARPFLVPGVRDCMDRVQKFFKAAGLAAIEGNEGGIDRNFNAAGLVAQASVRAKITEGPPPPLKESTLQARRRKGHTSVKTLVETGQLRNAINYVIRRRTGGQ